MKRYECELGSGIGGHDVAEMAEDPDGDWVRFEDAERLRSALFRYACHCGRIGEDPAVHAEFCPYRVALTEHPKTD